MCVHMFSLTTKESNYIETLYLDQKHYVLEFSKKINYSST